MAYQSIIINNDLSQNYITAVHTSVKVYLDPCYKQAALGIRPLMLNMVKSPLPPKDSNAVVYYKV